jgi:hypothetical protein
MGIHMIGWEFRAAAIGAGLGKLLLARGAWRGFIVWARVCTGCFTLLLGLEVDEIPSSMASEYHTSPRRR